MNTPTIYQIQVADHLDYFWSEWFDMDISHTAAGHTILSGPVIDQSALYGLLNKARDLGLTLLTVQRIELHNK